MPASMPTRHGGRFTNRAASRVRETFSRRTMAPFSSRPIICSVFLPVSMPMVRTTAVSALLGIACPPRALWKPHLILRGAGARPVHPIRDARLRDLKPQLEQFAVNAWRAPKWVLDTHPPDQRAQLRLDWRPPSPSTRFPTPVATKAGPVPTHERLGPHDRENPEDCWKPTIQLDKEPSIMVRQPDATMQPTPQYDQLMS